VKVIFTSDWQSELENLNLCLKAGRELLAHCQAQDAKFVVHCGDLKRAYNPLDGRMINTVVEIINSFTSVGINWIQLLGNHDRFGLHTDKDNWLKILSEAGAMAYQEPEIVSLMGGEALALLPFRQSNVMLKREAYDLAKAAKKSGGVHLLAFHCDLKLARYNVRASSEAEIRVEDLYPTQYDHCIGGHIHLQQRVKDNVYYVGSPFATDWGEANQVKGYLMYETGKGIKPLRSSIPGMYDPTWPLFPTTRTKWKGTKVRIHVQCDDVSDVFFALQKAKLEAQKKYVGAEIVAVPELQQRETSVALRAQDSDAQKIKTFVGQTLDESMEHVKDKITSYLISQLEKTGSVARRTGKFQFVSATALNFLSFEKLKIEYESGLTVVSGVNDDRRGKSNGSGKTSFLSPPSVALFGSTFKGQKHDHWMHRWVTKSSKSWVSLTCVDQSRRKCKIVRGRKPKFLRLWVEGKEVAAGNRPEQVQSAVEQLTGFTWETLANAIFVDQRRTNLMLVGTETERKQFLSRLQGLSRFEKALLEVKEDLVSLQRKMEEVKRRLISAQAGQDYCKQSLDELRKETPDIVGLKRDLAARVAKLESEKKKFTDLCARSADQKKLLFKKLEDVAEVLSRMDRRMGELHGRMVSVTEKIEKLSSLASECPTCEQSVDQEQKGSVIESLEELKRRLEADFAECRKLYGEKKPLPMAIRNKIHDLTDGEDELQQWIEESREEIATLVERLRNARGAEHKIHSEEVMLEKAKNAVRVIQKELDGLGRTAAVYEYCAWAFSKKGLPAFLNAQLCPILNKAAAYYSQVFSEKEIQVVFDVTEDGDSTVQVVNTHGGSDVNDQSQGELRIASLITSFALRHVAPQTNLLILDEPGEGLDPLAARTFARGLKQIASRFGSVFLVTHNTAMLTELAGSRHLVIKKKNRVSSVGVEHE
jgi:DNA repair exonuclease SbcCD nuclease subunit